MTEPNIILTGFMGTGKTSVGRQVAARLGRPFVDLDDLIAERAGKSVPEIFAQDGEPAFRALEATVCQELRDPAGLVLATGGGAALVPENRAALEAGGVLICLDASQEALIRRLAGKNGRPLLHGDALSNRIATLLAQRADAYASLPNHLDTSRLSIPEAVEQVLALAAGLPAGGYRLPVRMSTSAALGTLTDYDILIGEGLLAQAGQHLAAAGLPPGRCAVVTNRTVGQHHAAALREALVAGGFEPLIFEVPDGETYKTLDTAQTLYHRFAEARLARNEPVIALGGGVTGDLAGFVAATWLRGVPFVQAPTSLLAMVDASVGGKVGVDLPQGKNLVGAFKQPALVLMDTLTLRTLAPVEFRSGIAEVIKAAVIADPALFAQLTGSVPSSLPGVIAGAVRVKIQIVERDPFEYGDRAWLNLGHTFGHALELLSDYRLRHGEAVALGLLAAGELSVTLGHANRSLPDRLRTLLQRVGLPTLRHFDIAAAQEAMSTDKKRRGSHLRFVLPHDIGRVSVVEDVPAESVKAALRSIWTSEESEQP